MRRVFFALALAMPVAGAGCLAAVAVGAGAAVGTYLYVKGEVLREYSASLNRTWNACLATCRELGLTDVRGRPDRFGGTMTAKQADGTTVTIKLTAKGEYRTQVGVRFGTLGDRDKSHVFHDILNRKLATPDRS